MKRLRKILLVVAILMVVIVAAGGWSLNRWMQTPGGHARLEKEISDAIRMPLKAGKFSFSSWSGMTAEGISVPAADGHFFEAQSLSASHSFSSLVRGRIVLGDVRIIRPRVRLIAGPDGKWRLPEPPAKAPAGATIAVAAPAPAGTPAATSQATPPKPRKRIGVSIGKIVIENASAELIDRQRLPVVTVTGLNAKFRDVSEDSSSGEFSVESIIAPSYGSIGNLAGNAGHQGPTFTARNLSANVCNGRVTGEITFGTGSPANASLALENVNIGLLGKEIRTRTHNASGMVSGDIHLSGFDADIKAMTGQGSLVLKSGRCDEIELVRQIGQILQFAVLAGFEVQDTTAQFRVASERIYLSPLDVSLHPLGISVTGSVGFDETVALVGTLRAPADFVQRTGLVSGQFSAPDATGRQSVQFDIHGTLDKPKQNLAAQLTGTKDRKMQRIIGVQSVFSTLFGKKPDKPAPEAPKATAPPPPDQPRP